MFARFTNALKRSDSDAPTATQHQDGPVQDSAVLSPPDSISRNGSRKGHFRSLSRSQDKDNGSSFTFAKRVKSSLHLNSNMNDSNMSLTPTAKAELGAQPVLGSVRTIFNKERRPSAMQMQAAMRSDDALNRESTESARLSSPPPTVQAQNPMTPMDARQLNQMRSILRDKDTPGSGQNVRFFGRDNFRVISPNTSASMSATNSSGDPSDTPFMQRIQEMSPERDDDSNADSARYHSANGSPNNMFSPATTYASANSTGLNGISANGTPYLTPDGSQAANSLMPVPPPQLTGIFDFSAAHEHSVHTIRRSEDSDLRDTAIEIDEYNRIIQNAHSTRPTINVQPENRVSSHSTASSVSIETPNSAVNGSEQSLRRLSDMEDTPFHSLTEDSGEKQNLPARAASSLGLPKIFKRESANTTEGRAHLEFPGSLNAPSRVRALSERVFHRGSLEDQKNKADSGNSLYGNTEGDEPPDPFSAGASNYYNAAAGFPKTPPRIGHGRTDSVSGLSVHSGRSMSTRSGSGQSSLASATQTRGLVEDDMLVSLRTQLAFHQELATQYELDIRARDAHAALMSQKLQAHEAEAERRARAMRGMRRRVAELERAAAALEEQAERSALDNFERSVLDGASGDAMRELHQQMVELERERVETASREREVRMECARLVEEVRKREDALDEVKRQMEALNAVDEGVGRGVDDARRMLAKSESDTLMAMDRHQEIEIAWAEDRARLVSEVESLQKEVSSKYNELAMLQAEVEAQWSNTEKLNEKTDVLRKERDDLDRERAHLKNELSAAEVRISEMEIEWTESENRKAELEGELAEAWAAKEQLERERDQLRQEIGRDDSNGVANDQMDILKEERQLALDDAHRLQQMLLEREAENTEYAQKHAVKDYELEKLREELASMRRERLRNQNEQDRATSEADTRASEYLEQRNDAVRLQAAAEAEARELREVMKRLQEEADRLRINVRVLKQESADHEVKIVQLEKLREQDAEDKVGLNIALDSKQQELELLKRTIGVRGTGGATPAAPVRIGSRRDSAAFRTPMPNRPSSSLSDGARFPTPVSDNERSSKMAETTKPMVKSRRSNVGSTPGPAPVALKKGPRLSDTSLSAPVGRSRVSATAPRPDTATATKRVVSPAASGRRASIAISGIDSFSEASSAMSDKENETPRAAGRPVNAAAAANLATRRMSMQPLAVPA